MTIHSRSGNVGAALALGAALAVAPGTAQALSCEPLNDLGLPPDGAIDVPTDTLLWGYHTLLGPSGEVVDVDERTLLVGSFAGSSEERPVLIPRAPLQPDTEYTVLQQWAFDPRRELRFTFRTGAGPSGAPPSPPRLLSSEAIVGRGFDVRFTRLQRLEFDGITDHQMGLLGDIPDPSAAAEAGTLDALVSVRQFLLDAEASAQEPRQGPVLEWVSEDARVSVGIGDCSGWPRGAAEQQEARFGVFDLAGNFSGWTLVPLELPSEEEARAQVEVEAESSIADPRRSILSCSTAAALGNRGAGSAAWLALALGLCIAARRRDPPR